jgi:hypothetical protein
VGTDDVIFLSPRPQNFGRKIREQVRNRRTPKPADYLPFSQKPRPEFTGLKRNRADLQLRVPQAGEERKKA